MVETRKPTGGPLKGVLLPHVPIRHQIVAVGVGMDEEDDDVIQESEGLLVIHTHHLIDGFHELLCTEHLRGVESPIDPHHRFPLPGQGPGLPLRDPLSQSHPAGDLLIAGQVGVVLRGGDDGHKLRPAFAGPADLFQDHPGRLLSQAFPIRGESGVAGELVIGPDLVAEELHRRSNVLGG